jgi:hypothetical protein
LDIPLLCYWIYILCGDEGVFKMTIPIERSYALENTREFLKELLDPKKTPRIPKSIRRKAYWCLKHFPTELTIKEAQKKCPELFGGYTPKTFIDPPQGWKYGFPKVLPLYVEDIGKWLVENGYPEKDVEFALSHSRMWED